MATANNAPVFEYRGVEGLVIAEVTGDDNEENGGYVTGTVMQLAPVAEIGKTTETSNESKYYDNVPAMNVSGESPDEYEITCAGLTLEKQALITGKGYDETTGALIDGPRKTRYFAMGYKTKDTDGKYRYVWRFKGTFSIPPETNRTEDDGTETNNTTLQYHGIFTTHKFTKGVKNDAGGWDAAPLKGHVVSDREGLANLDTFFDSVTTPDTLTAKTA